ncbi:MAG: hypothetical protein MUE85_02450 [Microscillaceae bacterium]|jgi:hypothetical protein|nr:hypothetical protein [Microscillaceae bacterium]
MRREILKLDFSVSYFDDDSSLLEHIWQNTQYLMLVNEFKADLLAYVHSVETYQPKRVLVDASLINFTIMPDLQEWVDNNISKKVNKIAQKIAFVLPPDFFTQVALEQTVNEPEGSSFEAYKFFEDVDLARSWLLQK